MKDKHEITFEIPKYCVGCKIAEYFIEVERVYAGEEPIVTEYILTCRYGKACKATYEKAMKHAGNKI